MMTTDKIRKSFLDFFASKGHTVVSSDTLVPKDDPTVLFTTAGMQQFKRQFLGHVNGYSRAASSQKCLRTDDLDRVGVTAFHHTFFEMLGNFSFGDYFKKEAIAWAWEFLTKELKIPTEKIWVSVYTEDTEAEKIWLNDIKIPKARLVKLGDKSNFWPSEAKTKGPNGPCGPCSEIFYDYGENPNCPNAKKCNPDCDCGRFAEIWNLVFTQFNRKEGGALEPLPNKNIDTGMGLERLAAVIQGKKNNFETDLFAPILAAIEKDIAHGKISLTQKEKCIIADHIRAITIAINDGVIPSNDGRGYVVKKLIIDTTDLVLEHGASEPTIYKLVVPVAASLAEPYPEVVQKAKDIAALIRKMEEAYIKVKKERRPELMKEIAVAQKLPPEEQAAALGKIIFTYHDTHGLTIPVIMGTAVSAGTAEPVLRESKKEYEERMEDQKNRSRATSKMTGDVFADAHLDLKGLTKTEFIGHKELKGQGKVVKIFKDNQPIDHAFTGDTVQVVLNKTPFYAESGGQIGDTGTLTAREGKVLVLDTKRIGDIFLHLGRVEEGALKVHDAVEANVDAGRRLSVMRNHTATHLLQAALRKVLGAHVQQQGSLVAEDRLRFDFTHPQSLSEKQIRDIEQFVNTAILACRDVSKENMFIEEAKKRGALAFFAEKYGNTVRVVTIDEFSKELCGGTHLENTGQIGLFKITSESAIAQGIRRIEAKTGLAAYQLINENEEQLRQISKILRVPVADVAGRLEAQTNRLKQLEKEISGYRLEGIKGTINALIEESETAADIKIVTHTFSDIESDTLRKICDLIKQKLPSAAVILGAKTPDAASILIAVSDALVTKGIKANEIIQQIAPIINGSGGGRPNLAQAGGKDAAKLGQAIDEAKVLLKKKILS